MLVSGTPFAVGKDSIHWRLLHIYITLKSGAGQARRAGERPNLSSGLAAVSFASIQARVCAVGTRARRKFYYLASRPSNINFQHFLRSALCCYIACAFYCRLGGLNSEHVEIAFSLAAHIIQLQNREIAKSA